MLQHPDAVQLLDPQLATPAVREALRPAEPQSPPPDPYKRGNNGQFGLGNVGGPGNPFNRQRALLNEAFVSRFTPEAIARIADAVIERAANGDMMAARLGLAYALGKPTKPSSPDTLDREEMEEYLKGAVSNEQLKSLLETVQPEYAVDLLRPTLPCVAANLAEPIQAGLERMEEKEVASAEEVASSQEPEASAETSVNEVRGNRRARKLARKRLAERERREREVAQRQQQLTERRAAATQGGGDAAPAASGEASASADRNGK